MQKIAGFALVGFGIAFGGSSLASDMVLAKTDDTFIAPAEPDRNFNSFDSMAVTNGIPESINVTQSDPSANSAPTITSSAHLSAIVSETYRYDVDATDLDISDTLGFSLDLAPPSMSIDGASGLIQWTPTSSDIGFHEVIIRVRDNGQPMGTQTQSFEIIVVGASRNLLYFSTLGDTAIPGVAGPFDDADIYRFDVDTGQYDRAFDARNAGLPANADIDAMHVVDPVTFYLSFSRNAGTMVPGLGNVMDEDVVRYHAGQFSWFFHGSDIGLGNDGNAEDVAGLHLLSGQSILVTTVGPAKVPGVSNARPQDVLRCDGAFGPAASCTWSMFLDGSKFGLTTSNEKLDALFDFEESIYFSTTGPFSVPGLSGDNADIAQCKVVSGATPKSCAIFTKFFDGSAFGLADDLDGAHFSPNALADPFPATFRAVILGSSTASGTGASSPTTSWVGLLDSWLATVTQSHEVINLAAGGATTEAFRPEGSSPPPDVNRDVSRALELNPDLIILNFPSNNVATNISVATTISHYVEMKAAADERGVPLFLTTTQPRNFGTLAKRTQLQDEANAVRAAFGAMVIDIYDELTNFNNGLRIKSAYDSGDGTHLNDTGHQYIFETARARISSYVTP